MNPEALLHGLTSGLTPFLGLPHRLQPEPAAGVVLGAPFDGGVLHRPGARLGPWALRAATLGLGRLPMPLRLQGPEEEARSFAAQGWMDGGNVPTRPFDMAEALAAVEMAHAAWITQGARTLMLGGDHLMTLGALRAHARKHGPLGLLHFDAHPDAGHGELWGTPCHHGTWVRQALEEGLLDPHRTVQVGLRACMFPQFRVFRADGYGSGGAAATGGMVLICVWALKQLPSRRFSPSLLPCRAEDR